MMTIKTKQTYRYAIIRMALIFILILTLFSFIIFKKNNELPIPIIALPSFIFLVIILSTKHTEIIEIKEQKVYITFTQFLKRRTIAFDLKDCELIPYQYKKGILPAVHQLLIQKNRQTLFTINGLKKDDIYKLADGMSHLH